ncbi:hypothetical protein CS542_06755 [Pedobacter sp. IW39]|nr:hypothetical protein CS542_06755 [Pedobacter sp. IW39]
MYFIFSQQGFACYLLPGILLKAYIVHLWKSSIRVTSNISAICISLLIYSVTSFNFGNCGNRKLKFLCQNTLIQRFCRVLDFAYNLHFYHGVF